VRPGAAPAAASPAGDGNARSHSQVRQYSNNDSTIIADCQPEAWIRGLDSLTPLGTRCATAALAIESQLEPSWTKPSR